MISINTQSSIKIGNIYFDPFKIEKQTHDAEIIFITHPHYDHFDLESINKIIKEDTLIVVPKDEDIIRKLKNLNIIVIEPSKEYEIKGIKVKTIPAYNIDKLFHKKEYGWVGYIIYLDRSYYIMGDTDAIEEAKNIKCDYLFIPIGGSYTMDYKQAANLTNTIKPKTVTPIHYGSIVGNMEDERCFKELIDKNIEINLLLNNNKY